MLRKALLSVFIILFAVCGALAADPMATNFSFLQCQGSLIPYPSDIKPMSYPDSLEPVMINHVGRHGSRYPASAANTLKLLRALDRADSLRTITPLGSALRKLTRHIEATSRGRWGALDSLGMAEERSIATRMFYALAPVFKDAKVSAISSYSPRAMMSMYEFTNQLCRMDNHIEFTTSTGRQNSELLRPFDIDSFYKELRDGSELKDAYQVYYLENCPTAPIVRTLGKEYPFTDDAERQDLSLTEYYVLAGCAAMSVDVDMMKFLTHEEINVLWSCFNLRQYLNWTATTISTVPAEMASALLRDLIETTDSMTKGEDVAPVLLRFGHAETLMPLLSLMRMPGCYYMTNYFDTVGLHWQDFNIVPMAANLQMVLFRHKTNGRYYLYTMLNEHPVRLVPGIESDFVPWSDAREYLSRCLPFWSATLGAN